MTMANEDTNSIQTDDANRASQDNVAMQVAPFDGQNAYNASGNVFSQHWGRCKNDKYEVCSLGGLLAISSFHFFCVQGMDGLVVSSAKLGARGLSIDPQIVSLRTAKMSATNDKMHEDRECWFALVAIGGFLSCGKNPFHHQPSSETQPSWIIQQKLSMITRLFHSGQQNIPNQR